MRAQRMDRETLISWLTFAALGAWGGIISYYKKISAGAKHVWWRLIAEVATSALTGLLVSVVLLDAGYSFSMCAALGGVAGHMGGRLWDVGDDILESILRRLARVGDRNEPPTNGG
ncbi:MAG TPA: phage holin family protein [Steroidobacteraceae bacterium]|nr:phage holin family protein [Steroidobacteraceae bacterium]